LFDHRSPLNRNEYDTIIIGAGISGLTTSLILAKEGKKIALFERDFDIAPLIRPYMRKECEFSPGLHISGWMDEGEIIDTFLEYLNVADGVEKQLHKDGLANVIIDNSEYHIPRGLDKVKIILLSYFPEDVEAIDNYMVLINQINKDSFYFNKQLKPDRSKHGEFIGSTSLSLKDVMKRFHASDGLIDLLGTLNYFLIGSKAEEVPFNVHAFVVGGFYQSPGFFTTRGINRLLANYKRELERFGVDLFLNSEVDEILIDDNRKVTGIKVSNGCRYNSSNIIVSFDPKLLLEKIKTNRLRPVYRERLEEAENTFGLYVAFYEIKDHRYIDFNNYIYHNQNQNLTLALTSNYSGENLVLCCFLIDDDHKSSKEAGVKEKNAQEKLELLEKTLFNEIPGLSGLKNKATLLDFLKPWSFERYTKTTNGSAYGIKQTVNLHGFQHRVPIKGLYMVGQAIYPGFLGSMLSGFSLALEIIKSEDFWSKVIHQ
jgi:all-trans-retinol 13,14-reductase